MAMSSDYAMDYTVWADYYAYIVSNNATDGTTTDSEWEEYGEDYNMDDYYYDDYYGDEYIDYEMMYMYAPWDWGYSDTWKDNYMCADGENYYENYIEMGEGFSYRDDCIDWCYKVQEEQGGTCCGSAVVFDYYSYSTMVYCAVYDTEPGEYDYLPEEIDSYNAAFYSAFPLEEKRDGPMAQI